jgi:hypothetical protein
MLALDGLLRSKPRVLNARDDRRGFHAQQTSNLSMGCSGGIILDAERVLLLPSRQPLKACFRLAALSYLPFRSLAVLFLPLSPTAKPRRRSDEANSDRERDPHRQDVIQYTQGFLTSSHLRPPMVGRRIIWS